MKGYCFLVFLTGLPAVLCAWTSYADELSIYDVQYTTDPNGDSPYEDGLTHDVVGGIVTGKWSRGVPRVYLQDPAHLTWGGIVVKDFTDDGEFTNGVAVRDRVDLRNVYIEESRGNTTLHYGGDLAPNAEFSILGSDNPLPPPIIVSVSDIPAPVEDGEGNWYVGDYGAEPYEAMRMIVRDVTVTEKHLGKNSDNYNLQTPYDDSCWAADYMNEEVEATDYHRFVMSEQHFCAVAGLFEQYKNRPTGWDYYQLVTWTTVDLALCGDADSDGNVDLDDVPRFHECLLGPVCNDAGCNPPAWWQPPGNLPVEYCLMMDMDYDGDVDLRDFADVQVIFGTDYMGTRGR